MKKQDHAICIASIVLLVLSIYFIELNIIPVAIISLVFAIIPLLLKIRSLTKINETDEKTVEEQLETIKNERQQHANSIQKANQKALDEIEDFRSVLSHQLRMPLSIVQGYADILVRDLVIDEDVKKEYLHKIVDRTNYISSILANQLSIHRSMDEILPAFLEIDLIDLLRRVGEDLQTIAGNQGIQIQTLSTIDSLIIEADAHQLNKVIFNIVENSLKYMGREGHITIYTEVHGETVCITIKDDGLGLDSEETKHIFEHSYQGSNNVSGHGHGLYLAKHATEIHGGSISATSAPGMGMSTKITLPIHQPKEKVLENI